MTTEVTGEYEAAIQVFRQAITTWESVDLAIRWLDSSVPALEGERPIDLLGSREGRSRVSLILENLENGNFS